MFHGRNGLHPLTDEEAVTQSVGEVPEVGGEAAADETGVRAARSETELRSRCFTRYCISGIMANNQGTSLPMKNSIRFAHLRQAFAALFVLGLAQMAAPDVAAQTSVVPGQGGQDAFGPYEPVPGWPRDFSTFPGYEDWTWGAAQGIFAESADRIFILQRGILRKLDRPEDRLIDEQGTLLRFPVGRQYPWRDGTLPWRDGTVASPDHNNEDGWQTWEGAGYRRGVDARWEHCMVVVDREGNIVETWSQWDSMFMKPHAVHVNP